ncbi:peptidylprolyl isomerase [Pengzhenrongella sicca]|uniref:Peptidylprolyl isomerase n=1 Tax=Pengzhenrongella sicca TaxID=2819238 RepID=A0A8A4ZAX2_9MICO|nr:peptidylprolyl isomerase [Pengzhenrongella sicca]QTE28033.1 peptidylprolyl isomerase [Pengzhenrongella sicca]
MSPSKREREYARRRYERYQQHVATERSKRQQRRRAALAALVVLLVVLGTALTAAVLDGRKADVAGDSPSADASASADPAADTATYTLPDPSFAEGRTWTGTISTSVGDIGIELDGAAAPQAVASFVSLAQQGYFDSTPCHRLVTGGIKVLQCGDPTGAGTGGPGYSFGPVENAPADDVYPAGTIAMARIGDDAASMGSQFFLVYEDSTIPADSAGGYTIFGRMTSGLDVVTAVADAGVEGGETDGPPATSVTIQGVETQ